MTKEYGYIMKVLSRKNLGKFVISKQELKHILTTKISFDWLLMEIFFIKLLPNEFIYS